MINITRELFHETFAILRACGNNKHECQVLWLAASATPTTIVSVRHSEHKSDAYGLEVETTWLNDLWMELATTRYSICAQVHTHPGAAGHSETDDAYPIIGTPGFASIVIPDFAAREPTIDQLYVTFIKESGGWLKRDPRKSIHVK
jgi:hypothetical protein